MIAIMDYTGDTHYIEASLNLFFGESLHWKLLDFCQKSGVSSLDVPIQLREMDNGWIFGHISGWNLGMLIPR